MQADQLLVIINLILPVLLIGVCLPLVYRKIPRNQWYGFRTPKTLSSDEMWYRTNRIGGEYFIVAAVVELAAAVILSAWPGLQAPRVIWVILPTAPLLIAVLAWLIRVRNC